MRRFLAGLACGLALALAGVYQLGAEGVVQVGLKWAAASETYAFTSAPSRVWLADGAYVEPDMPKVRR